MTNSGNKRKLDESEIEEAASALQNLSLTAAEVATQESKRRRKTRSRLTKTQSRIQRRKDSNGGHAKSHPKDLPFLNDLDASITAMLTSIRKSMSNGTKSSDAMTSQPAKTKHMSGSSVTELADSRKKTLQPPKAENHEQSSCKRRPRSRHYSDDKSKKISRKPACTTDSTIEELALSLSRLSLNS